VAHLADETSDPASRKRAAAGGSLGASLGAEASNRTDHGVFAVAGRTIGALGGGFIVLFLAVLAGGVVFGLRRRHSSSDA
jgi:hypothetical protein